MTRVLTASRSAISAAVGVGFAIQCIAIRGPNLGLDGGLSLALAVIPVPDALTFLAHDVHPPLYYVVLRAWIALVGAHPFAVKYLTVTFATLSVAAFAAWTRRLLGARAAFQAAVLLSLSALVVQNAATVRDLAPGLCLVILNCWTYCEARQAPGRRVWTYAHLISGILAIWTSFLAIGPLVAQAGHLVGSQGWFSEILTGRVARWVTLPRSTPQTSLDPMPGGTAGLTPRGGSRSTGASLPTNEPSGELAPVPRPESPTQRSEPFDRGARALLLSLGAILLSIVPWLAFAIERGWLATLRSGGPTARAAAPPLLASVRAAVSLLLTGSDSTRGWILLAVLALLLVILGPSRKGDTSRLSFAVIGLVATFAFALIVTSTWLRLDVPARYLAPVLPFWLLGVVWAAGRIAAWRAWPVLVVLGAVNAIGLASWYRQPALPASFWDPSGVQAFLDTHLATNDRAVFLTYEQAGYYTALSPRPHPWATIPVGTSYLERSASANAGRALSPLLTSPRTLWVVEYHGVLGPGQQAVDRWLIDRAYPAPSHGLSDSDVHPYLTGANLGPDRLVQANFADGVTLTTVAFPDAARPGGIIPVRLTWHADHPLTRDLTVFVHLVDARGQTLAQQDAQPVAGELPTTRWQGIVVDRHAVALPKNAPPGPYTLEVGLYDRAGRLAVEGRSDGSVRIGPIVSLPPGD